jgi:tripartite-type tricarboxylate transporter receptor subunit TctC
MAMRRIHHPILYFAFLCALCVLCGKSLVAFAEDYPSKPIRIIVPYPPGGFNDTLARTLGQKFTQAWQQAVIVDNRPGGGSTIGTNLAAKAPPDGYTLLIVSFAFAVNPALYGSLPYDSDKDFTPVVLAASTPNPAGRQSAAAGEVREGTHRLGQIETRKTELRFRRQRLPRTIFRWNCSRR